MKTLLLATLFTTWALCSRADAKAYIPLGALESPPGGSRSILTPAKVADRPILPGKRPAVVELMEDALSRKQPHTIGSNRRAAQDSIIRNFLRNPVKRAHAKGMLAEALFLAKNPHWGYVKSPNAPQHDLYTWIKGRRPPFTAQVKTHSTPNSALYAREMLSDYRSNLFLVPDDHVAPLKEHWRQQLAACKALGLTEGSDAARRQLARIRGLGFSTKELDSQFATAFDWCLRERNATYISLGASAATVIGPELWDWWRTGSIGPPAVFHIVRAGSIIAAERSAAYALAQWRAGALRGSLRGNLVTGLAVLGVDTGFSVYQNGGWQATRSASFYTHLGGGIGGTTLGLIVGGPVGVTVTEWAAPTGFWAPVIGTAAGLFTGSVVGIAGYIGGEVTSRKILEVVNPSFLHDAENATIRDARGYIADAITILQNGTTLLP